MRRMLIGMSQEKLGERLGLTFQQVQKYEKGVNRIGASRLQQISEILGVPESFFFEGAPKAFGASGDAAAPAGFAEEGAGSAYVVDFLSTAEGVQLNRAFASIKNPKLRRKIVELVRSLAEDDEAA
jgi:transcriptional regulator with XRE-family HTH domain